MGLCFFQKNTYHTQHVMSETQTQVQDQRCQSGPSAKTSVIPGEGDSSKNSDNECRFQIFISTNSLTQQHLLVGR